MYKRAITRKPAPNFADGVTTANLGHPNYELILQQHVAYIQALKSVGLNVIELEPLTQYPDSYFVEDTAVVVPEMAIITNPGAASRKGEEEHIIPALKHYRKIVSIKPPGTMDGGDVMAIDKNIFIGISERTNQAGAEQMEKALAEYEYSCIQILVGAGLHLKSSVNYIGNNTLIVTKEFAMLKEFENFHKIVVEDKESYAANALLINDYLLVPSGFLSTREKVNTLGMKLIELDMSEVRKMDGGLTCMSLRF